MQPDRPDNMLLLGVVGSQAHGLATATSDIDRAGIYAMPTEDLFTLNPEVGRHGTTIVTRAPDATYHEAAKFANLAFSCNPSVMELLWLTTYEQATTFGLELLALRTDFLSAERVRHAYAKYAFSQLARLSSSPLHNFAQRKQAAKQARHMLRLIDQGLQLYTTGTLTVAVDEPERYMEFGEQVVAAYDYDTGSWEAQNAVGATMRAADEQFEAVTSVLPEVADRTRIAAWLQRVRYAHLPQAL